MTTHRVRTEGADVGLASPFAAISLLGRLVIALHTLERYCRRLGLEHPAIAEFRDHLWQLPAALRTPDKFEAWHEATPTVCLGTDDEPARAALLASASARGVPAAEFSALIDAVAEIVYGSFYGAAEDSGSLRYLEHVLRVGAARGVTPPPASLVASSRFADQHGWGKLPDADTVARWRSDPDAA